MTRRREALRAYLLEVTREMTCRGQIRTQRGDALDDILRSEGSRVIAGVFDDLKVLATELGLATLPVIAEGAHDLLDRGLAHALGYVARKLSGAHR